MTTVEYKDARIIIDENELIFSIYSFYSLPNTYEFRFKVDDTQIKNVFKNILEHTLNGVSQNFCIKIEDFLFKNCLVKSIAEDPHDILTVTIVYNSAIQPKYERIANRYAVTWKGVSFNKTTSIVTREKSELDIIMDELDLWLTNETEFFEKKLRGEIHYV